MERWAKIAADYDCVSALKEIWCPGKEDEETKTFFKHLNDYFTDEVLESNWELKVDYMNLGKAMIVLWIGKMKYCSYTPRFMCNLHLFLVKLRVCNCFIKTDFESDFGDWKDLISDEVYTFIDAHNSMVVDLVYGVLPGDVFCSTQDSDEHGLSTFDDLGGAYGFIRNPKRRVQLMGLMVHEFQRFLTKFPPLVEKYGGTELKRNLVNQIQHWIHTLMYALAMLETGHQQLFWASKFAKFCSGIMFFKHHTGFYKTHKSRKQTREVYKDGCKLYLKDLENLLERCPEIQGKSIEELVAAMKHKVSKM